MNTLKKYSDACLVVGLGMFVLYIFILFVILESEVSGAELNALLRLVDLFSLDVLVMYTSMALCSIGVAFLARSKGYNLIVSILGFIFTPSFIGAIIIFLLPDKNKQELKSEQN